MAANSSPSCASIMSAAARCCPSMMPISFVRRCIYSAIVPDMDDARPLRTLSFAMRAARSGLRMRCFFHTGVSTSDFTLVRYRVLYPKFATCSPRRGWCTSACWFSAERCILVDNVPTLSSVGCSSSGNDALG